MHNSEIERELARLRFEDFLWLFYGSIIIANMYGGYYEKKFLRTRSVEDSVKFNSIFEIILILTFFIYVYLFLRNYTNYQRAPINEKKVYLVRTFGAVFLIMGILCLIYYQDVKRRNPG